MVHSVTGALPVHQSHSNCRDVSPLALACVAQAKHDGATEKIWRKAA